MKTAIVLQARMGSTRLPGKSLLPLGDSTLVEQAMTRLSLVPAEAYVLATDEASADALSGPASRRGFDLLIGPADDVLARYCLAIRRYGLELVIRATGDNPLVSYELADSLLERRAQRPSDYAGYLGMPIGMGVELLSAAALLVAESKAEERREREHVSPYLYDHPALFDIDRPMAPDRYDLPGASVTVDTAEDFESVSRIYESLYDGDPISDSALLDYLRGSVP